MNAQELANKIVADAMEVSGPYSHCTESYFRKQLAGFKATARAIGIPCPFDTDVLIEAAEIAADRISQYESGDSTI